MTALLTMQSIVFSFACYHYVMLMPSPPKINEALSWAGKWANQPHDVSILDWHSPNFSWGNH